MKQEMQLEMRFFRRGKLVGGSFATFTGEEGDFDNLFNEGDEEIETGIVEYMSNLAGVRRFDDIIVRLHIESLTDNEEAESTED